MVGECCAKKIEHLVLSGIFLHHDYDTIPHTKDDLEEATLTPAEIGDAVERLQNHVAGVDRFASDIAKRAGIPTGRMRVTTSDNPWKADDAAWFKANPSRSHRLRPMFPGEETTLFDPGNRTALPPNHAFQVLVRQVQPGMRARVPFGRNTEVPIPDIEPLMHALFDLAGGTGKTKGVISTAEIAKLARSYAEAAEKNTRTN